MGRTPRIAPLSASQPSPTLIGMLQEQQGLLQKLLHEQQEVIKAVNKNDKRIALIQATLEKYNKSSYFLFFIWGEKENCDKGSHCK